jgi:hypothetical protein
MPKPAAATALAGMSPAGIGRSGRSRASMLRSK